MYEHIEGQQIPYSTLMQQQHIHTATPERSTIPALVLLPSFPSCKSEKEQRPDQKAF